MGSTLPPMITEPEEGIFRVAIPVPLPLRFVYSYVITLPQGVLVVDLGMDTPEARDVWQRASETLGLRPGRVWGIVITHFHPDHIGLSSFAQALWECPVMMLEEEKDTAYQVFTEHLSFSSFFTQHGLPATDVHVLDEERTWAQGVKLPAVIQGLHANTYLGDLQVIEQKGHTDHQLVLYWPSRELLFTGDQVLDRITPNISFWPDADPDPLASYLTSLKTLQTLPVKLALPAHEALIVALSDRIDEIVAHHHERAQQVLTRISQPHTAYEVAQSLFRRPLTPSQWRFALSETLAHLEYLRLRGQVTCITTDSVTRYVRLTP